MSVTKLLIANRGEVAIRIARAAADLGVPTVAVHSEDDARSLHLRMADACRALPGQGATAYLDVEAIVAAATALKTIAYSGTFGLNIASTSPGRKPQRLRPVAARRTASASWP